MATKTISLLLESRISDFKKKYGSELAPADINYIISKDPSKNQKYLDWIGKTIVAAKEDDDWISPEEIMADIALFHKNIKGVDLYSLKSFDQLQSLVHKPTQPSSRQKILQGADIIVNDKNWLVVAPRTHDASMFFGGGTRWCISTSSEEHWNDHYNKNGEAIIMLKNRKLTPNRFDWKICITVDPNDDNLDYAQMYDIKDHASSIRNSNFYSYVPEYVVDKIERYLQNEHDGISRQEEYQKKEEEEKLNSYIEEDAADDLIKYYFKYYFSNLPDYITDTLDEDKLKQFLIKNLTQEKFNSIISRFAYNQVSNYGHDQLGYIPNKNMFDRLVSDDDYDNETNDFYYYANAYLFQNASLLGFHKYIEGSMSRTNYDRLTDIFDLNAIIEDVINKQYQLLNNQNQTTFVNIPATIERVVIHNLNDALTLFRKYGYTQLADAIVSYSTGPLREINYKKLAILIHF